MSTKNPITIFLFFISIVTFSQNVNIVADNGKFIIDEDLKLIVCNKNVTAYNDLSTTSSLTIELNGNSYTFNTVPNKLENGKPYNVTLSSTVFQLYFSKLPLLNIDTSNEIQDEPKVLANLKLTDTSNSEAILSYCGIELRGGFSQSYPKKSYDIELWKDQTGDNSKKESFLNMRKDDDWILISMYNEPLRIRNMINHKLWREIHTPYYIEQENKAFAGIRTEYIELAINNEYMGIYALGEQIDKKQLQLKKYKTSIKGELYKGISWGDAVTFSNLENYNNNSRIWSGFETKYPKESDITNWDNLYNFVDFVINSSDEDFQNTIHDKFQMHNAIDYFIFLNLLRATDNTGKNIYIAKYNENEPYFYAPWDLDGTHGIIWNGERRNKTDDILSNDLYNRLFDTFFFNKAAAKRWFELRDNSVLETSHLVDNISKSYNFLLENGNYERETLKWGAASIDLSNLDYTYTWLANRLNFLDVYFGGNLLGVPENSIPTNNITVSPNPINSTFKIKTTHHISSYKIYDSRGKLVKNELSYDNEEIHIENLSSGIYFLRALTDINNQFVTIKILKQ